MSEIRVELASEFRGESVVLLAMDVDGLTEFKATVAQAVEKGHESFQMVHADVTHVFAIEDGVADVELKQRRVTWRLSPSKLKEILDKLNAMSASPVPCHHYVDITSPAETLMLSRDEYVSDKGPDRGPASN